MSMIHRYAVVWAVCNIHKLVFYRQWWKIKALHITVTELSLLFMFQYQSQLLTLSLPRMHNCLLYIYTKLPRNMMCFLTVVITSPLSTDAKLPGGEIAHIHQQTSCSKTRNLLYCINTVYYKSLLWWPVPNLHASDNVRDSRGID